MRAFDRSSCPEREGVGAKRSLSLGAALLVFAFTLTTTGLAVSASQSRRTVNVSSQKYAYTVDGADRPEIRVTQGDIVRITFSTRDIPHSFTVNEYRIMRRAEPGKPVTIEFLADTVSPLAGFPIKCTLAIDSRCKEMAGALIVQARKTPSP